MIDADRQAYLDAFSAAKKRVERDGSKICHVIWRDGHLQFTAAPKLVEVPGEPDEFGHAVRPHRQGLLI